MLSMVSATQYSTSENKRLQSIIDKLTKENKALEDELVFYKTISDHSNSLVGNMYVKYVNGTKIWIDSQSISYNKELLYALDKDEDVLDWIKNINIKFKDNDW